MSCEFNAVLVGRYGVGKTTLFKTIRAGKPQETDGDELDEGVDCLSFTKTVDGRNVRVTLWDTGGQERHDSLTSNYYRSVHAVVLVYTMEDQSSLYSLSEWVDEAKELSGQGDRLILALWGAKADLPKAQQDVKPEAIAALTSTYNIPDQLNCKVSIYDDSPDRAMTALLEHLYTQLTPKTCSDTDIQELNRTAGKTVTLHKTPADNDKKKCC